MKLHLERALFMIGRGDAGKSTQLNSLKTVIAKGETRRRIFDLGNNRRIYVRSGSPQELGETLSEFLQACEYHMRNWDYRWNYACAVQTDPADKIPGAVGTITAFKKAFSPDRICAVILSPNRRGNRIPGERKWLIKRLSAIGECEILTVNARKMNSNGPLYSKFFGIS